MLAKGGGTAPTLIRQEMIPGLSAGLIAPAAPLAGQAFPQPGVSAGPGQECLLDDLIEPCFRLVVASPCDTPALRALAAAHGIRVIVLDATAVTAANPNRLYLLYEAKPGGGLYRSDDAGASWQMINGTPAIVQAIEFTDDLPQTTAFCTGNHADLALIWNP